VAARGASAAAGPAGEGRRRAFRQVLKESGYVEGENVAIEYRFAGDQMERLPELLAELALQLPFPKVSESIGNHDSKIVDAGGVD
jgi:hypothetical protein